MHMILYPLPWPLLKGNLKNTDSLENGWHPKPTGESPAKNPA